MTHQQSLTTILNELKQITGVPLQVETSSPEDLELAVSQLKKLCSAYKETYDRTHFLKRLLHTSLPAYDIADEARKLHIKPDERRALFLLQTAAPADEAVFSILKSLFPDQMGTFVFPVTETLTAVIQTISKSESNSEHLTLIASSVVDTLNTEALISVKVAYSVPLHHLSELSEAYQKGHLALKIGQLFSSEQSIFSYDELGIGRLIYQLPEETCIEFLNEVFKNQVPETLDPELISTINRFFLNNLNIAETARQLHMHRNTLIYRLEQVQKRTGLDLRNFEDAMIFKVALMVMNYRKERILQHE